MLAGIREILIITTPHDRSQFEILLGDGSSLGISFKYATQSEPKGLAEAFIIGEEFLAGDSCLMILGDNIFHGVGLGRDLVGALPASGAHIFTYEVSNPADYGIIEIDEYGKICSITEKPLNSISNLAITGLYFFDKEVSQFAKNVTPSARGELEITSIINMYLENSRLSYTQLSRGTAWLDTGNPNSMHDASTYIKVIEDRTGSKIACLEEIAYGYRWIDSKQLGQAIKKLGKNIYSEYLRKLLSSNI